MTTLVAASWRLRAARAYLAGQTTWRTLLLGSLEGEWDGTANWTYSGADDDEPAEEDMPVTPCCLLNSTPYPTPPHPADRLLVTDTTKAPPCGGAFVVSYVRGGRP